MNNILKFGLALSLIMLGLVAATVIAEPKRIVVSPDIVGSLQPGRYSGITIQRIGESADVIVLFDPLLWAYSKKLNAFTNNAGEGVFKIPTGSKIEQDKANAVGWQQYIITYPTEETGKKKK
ncbi:MAG: hypothetical protein Ta2F_11180 [Termitinemataceae bacterium]|nr:MAG: hypothetical protein Ta2F_11180 [Termitinemataceae bacterium]